PFKVCGKHIDYLVRYTFNSTVNHAVFKDAEYTLSLLHGRLEAINSSKCNDPINLMITRTLRNDSASNKEYVITANYAITIGIKQVYWSNYSVLNSIRGKIEECSGQVVNDIVATGSFESGLALNISGKIFEAEFDTINDERKNQYCDSDHYRCPPGSKEVSRMCECSRGTYLDENVTACTPCPKDTYQENTGMFNCTQCEEGLTTLNKTGIWNRKACAPECSRGTYLDVNVTTCTPCPKDTYQENTGMFNCTKCEEGHTTLNKTGIWNRKACKPDIQPSPSTPSAGEDMNVVAIALPIPVLVAAIVAGVI
ncbi:Hypothetical predicted protein, partial [Paramuricea clavata]